MEYHIWISLLLLLQVTKRGLLFICFIALIIRMRIIKLMRDCHLIEKYSMVGMLLELEKIKKIDLTNGKNQTGIDTPQQVLDLSSSPDNYINLENVQLIIWNKNHTTLSINTKKKVGSGPQYFSIEVFPENKTYKTTKKEIKDSLFLKQITEGQVKNAIDKKSKNSSENVVTESYRTIQVAILSEDPVFLDLAKTWHRLDFSADGSTVIYNYRLINGAAYTTPWPFNTHWYIYIQRPPSTVRHNTHQIIIV